MASVNLSHDVRTQAVGVNDKADGKYSLIARIASLNSFGSTRYFDNVLIFRVVIAMAGALHSKTYSVMWQRISDNNKILDFSCIENNDATGNINVIAIENGDFLNLYIRACTYSYNQGFDVQILYQNRANSVELLANQLFEKIDITNAMSAIDNTLLEPMNVEIVLENEWTAERAVCNHIHKKIYIKGTFTAGATSGTILSYDYQNVNKTQDIIAFNLTQKSVAICRAYANTKALTITNLGNSVAIGDEIIVDCCINVIS